LFGYTSVAQRIFSHSSFVNGSVGLNSVFGVFKNAAQFSFTQPRVLQNPRNAFKRSSFFKDVIGAIFHEARYVERSSTVMCFSSFEPKNSFISRNSKRYLFRVSTERWRLLPSSRNRSP